MPQVCKAKGQHSLGGLSPHSKAGLVGPPSSPGSQSLKLGQEVSQQARRSASQNSSHKSSLLLMVLLTFLLSGHGLSWPSLLASSLPIFTVKELSIECKAWTNVPQCDLPSRKKMPRARPGNLRGSLHLSLMCILQTQRLTLFLLGSSALPWRRPEAGQGNMKGRL